MSGDLAKDSIDEAVLALLYLNICGRPRFGGACAWMSLNWDALDRLHNEDPISNPASKAKSAYLTDEGLARAEAACQRLFKDDS